MKNHRDVCLAREAGYAEYSGLPGKVKTGCPNTPQPNSRYCASHMPTAFMPVGESDSATESAKVNPSKVEQQLAFINAKKITRQSTFYQVLVCLYAHVQIWYVYTLMCTLGHTYWVFKFLYNMGTCFLPPTFHNIRV